ncbi:Nsp1-like C-terminal region-domain-containing protein [Phaeosphaeriaceae sp. PMI808]|nr:Nsp1-like C-terminal region-domain-containing protein [Phaeosphaeriaceae sp. PMI808]
MSTGFSFGQQSSSNTPNKPLFGAVNNSSAGSTPALFGSAKSSAPTSAGGSGLFGGAPKAGASNVFGGSGSSGTPAFGGGSLSKPSGDTTKASPFGGSPFGGTPSATTTSTPSFGFGAAASSTPAATPAATKTSFLPSTTPAGAPPGPNLFGGQTNQPGGNAPGSQSLFGAPKAQPGPAAQTGSSIFGGQSNQVGGVAQAGSSIFGAKPAATSSAPSPGLFAPGPGLFGGNKNTLPAASSGATPVSAAPSSLFNAQGQSTPKTLFGAQGAMPSSSPATKPPSFGLGTTSAPAPTASSQPPSGLAGFSLGGNTATPTASAAPTSSLFSGAGANPAASTGGSSLFTLGKPSAPAPGSTPTTSGATTTTAASATPTTTAPASSMFSGFGGGSAAPATTASTTAASGAPSLFKTATTAAQPSTSTSTSQPAPTLGATTNDASKAAGLAASTAGPAPSAQSRLKNKTMDEIITRWASDLSKYQKEFQGQAETVAKWDRTLVENSDKIRSLYNKTFQAERDASEVERQLTLMEENQQELDSYLDRYEKEIESLMKMHGVSGKSDGLRGPDQEREKTYKLAEKLSDRLNGLNRDLTEMIEEINTTSQTLSKTGKPDDPLTKVVRVLNTQLSNLQKIDSGASELQEKINKAQKESQRVGANGWNGLGTNPADDFYKSYRGNRTERFGGVS